MIPFQFKPRLLSPIVRAKREYKWPWRLFNLWMVVQFHNVLEAAVCLLPAIRGTQQALRPQLIDNRMPGKRKSYSVGAIDSQASDPHYKKTGHNTVAASSSSKGIRDAE
jgi:hypothetical protein